MRERLVRCVLASYVSLHSNNRTVPVQMRWIDISVKVVEGNPPGPPSVVVHQDDDIYLLLPTLARMSRDNILCLHRSCPRIG